MQFLSTPANISNATQVSFEFRCINELFNCKFVCSFDRGNNQTCYNGISYNVNSKINYEFVVYAIDAANNVGDSISFRFDIDQTPPVITPLNDVTVDNCDNLNPNITGIPKVTDNYDANPNVFYIDLADLDSCGTERNWFAKDSAGNVAILKQQIFILNATEPYVDDKDKLVIPCDNLNNIISNLNNIKLNVVQKCNSKLTITYQDSSNITKCGINLIR